MSLPREESEVALVSDPCVACGKPAECEAWNHALCYECSGGLLFGADDALLANNLEKACGIDSSAASGPDYHEKLCAEAKRRTAAFVAASRPR